MTDFTPDVLAEPPDEPVVHWMECPPSSYGPAVITGALTGAFMLGVFTTLGVIAISRMLAGDEV